MTAQTETSGVEWALDFLVRPVRRVHHSACPQPFVDALGPCTSCRARAICIVCDELQEARTEIEQLNARLVEREGA